MSVSSPSERIEPARVGDLVLPRETSGLTSRLILAYVERKGGRDAVETVLAKCGLTDVESDLLDERHWFSFATKVRLFEAAAEVLEDPHVTRNMGEIAIDLNVG